MKRVATNMLFFILNLLIKLELFNAYKIFYRKPPLHGLTKPFIFVITKFSMQAA